MNSYTFNANGLQVAGNTVAVPNPPKELIAVTAVQIQSGWVGQVLVNGEIVKEFTYAEAGKESVLRQANEYVVDKIKEIFRG